MYNKEASSNKDSLEEREIIDAPETAIQPYILYLGVPSWEMDKVCMSGNPDFDNYLLGHSGRIGCSFLIRSVCASAADDATINSVSSPPASRPISDKPYMPVIDHDRLEERVIKFAAIAPKEMQDVLAELLEALEDNKQKVHDLPSEKQHFRELALAYDNVSASIPAGIDRETFFTLADISSTMLEASEVLEYGHDIDTKEWIYRR